MALDAFSSRKNINTTQNYQDSFNTNSTVSTGFSDVGNIDINTKPQGSGFQAKDLVPIAVVVALLIVVFRYLK
jgi:hypothetical protein